MVARRRLEEGRVAKPLKPKRAPTAYMVFMKKYMRSQNITSREEAKNAIKSGAKIWNGMSNEEKEKYARKSATMRANYQEDMIKYRQELKASRPPPRPFAAFVRDYYKSGEFTLPRQKEELIPELGRCASLAWHGLQPDERSEYTQQFSQEYQDYKLRMFGESMSAADCSQDCQDYTKSQSSMVLPAARQSSAFKPEFFGMSGSKQEPENSNLGKEGSTPATPSTPAVNEGNPAPSKKPEHVETKRKRNSQAPKKKSKFSAAAKLRRRR